MCIHKETHAHLPGCASQAKNPNGPRNYKGYAVPLMVAESDPIASNPFETHKTLPPIAVDHHHDVHSPGSQLHHTHSGKAHRHV